MVFVNVYIHFWIWTRIRIQNPRVTDPDPAKVMDPCGSGSTTLHYIDQIPANWANASAPPELGGKIAELKK
jgi:hypothetical protein